MLRSPVRRTVLEQTIVVRGLGFAPAALGVVAGLVRKQRSLFGVEVNDAFGVGVALWLIQNVHGYEGKPASPRTSSPRPLYRR